MMAITCSRQEVVRELLAKRGGRAVATNVEGFTAEQAHALVRAPSGMRGDRAEPGGFCAAASAPHADVRAVCAHLCAQSAEVCLRLALRWAARAVLLALGCALLLVMCSGALLALDHERAALLGVEHEALAGVRFAALLTVRRGVLLTLVLVPAVLAWDVVTAAGTPSPGAITPYLDALDRWAAGPVCLAAGVIVVRLGGVSAAEWVGRSVAAHRAALHACTQFGAPPVRVPARPPTCAQRLEPALRLAGYVALLALACGVLLAACSWNGALVLAGLALALAVVVPPGQWRARAAALVAALNRRFHAKLALEAQRLRKVNAPL